MSFKAAAVAIGTGDTDIYTCPAGLEAAGKVFFSNKTASAVVLTVKFYDASAATTTTIISRSVAANADYPFPIPAAFEQGDKLIANAASSSAILATYTITQSDLSPAATGFNPMGAYSAGTTYAKGDTVSSAGSSYVSRIDGNIGNTPVSSTTQWQVIANKGDAGASGGVAGGGTTVVGNLPKWTDVVGATLGDSGVAFGDVVAASAAFANDNRLLRSDGTGKGSQASTVIVSDAGAMSGITTLAASGIITAGADGSAALDLVTKQQLDLKLDKAGGTLTGALTLAADGSSALHPVTKQQLDSAVLGTGKRSRVRAATTANITISTALNNADTLDGVTLATGDQVLVKNQSAPADNGIYVVGVSPARAAEYDSWGEFPGSMIVVEEGTANGDTFWFCTSNDGGTLNTTALAFSQLGVTPYTAAAGISLSSFAFSLDLASANIWNAAQTFLNSSGIKIKDTDASNTTGIVGGSNLTADRTLTLTFGDRNMTINLAGDLVAAGAVTFAGAYTFTGTLTGNTGVTFPTSGTLATTADVTNKPEVLMIAVSDENTTAITTGTAKVTFRMPYAFTVTSVKASLTTASSSGIPTIDINEAGTTILSTKLTIDASELTSATAATPAVISDASLAADAEMTIDIDVAGTGAKGLKVYIIGHQ